MSDKTTYDQEQMLLLIAESIEDLTPLQCKQIYQVLFPDDNITMRGTKIGASYTCYKMKGFSDV